MSSPPIVFPPPPPPPPGATANHYATFAPSNFSSSGRGGSYQHDRGGFQRGRGNYFSGSRGGGSRGSSRDIDSTGRGHSRFSGILRGNHGQVYGSGLGGHVTSQNPSIQQPQNPYQQNEFGYNPEVFQPHHNGVGPISSDVNGLPNSIANFPNNGSYSSITQTTYRQSIQTPSHQLYPVSHQQPLVMGPPLRMGFDRSLQGVGSDDHTNQSHIGRFDNHRSLHQSLQPTPNQHGRSQKRHLSEISSQSQQANSTSPAVPRFGIPLPSKPPTPQEHGKKPKKKRKRNQLGLTPKVEEHDSSEEEDADEESKLVAAQFGGAARGSQQLVFTYKGQTATLKSTSDIAAWIAERKKRFPTKARADEVRQEKEAENAARQARREEQRQERRLQQQEQKQAKRKQGRQQKKVSQSEDTIIAPHEIDAEARAKKKAEKLRKKYEKAQKLVVKMEADKIKSNNSDQLPPSIGVSVKSKPQENSTTISPGTEPTNIGTESNGNSSSKTVLSTQNIKKESLEPMEERLYPLAPISEQHSQEDSSAEAVHGASDLTSETKPTSMSNGLEGLLQDKLTELHPKLENIQEDLDVSLSTPSSELSSSDDDSTSSSGSSSDDEAPASQITKSGKAPVSSLLRSKRETAICRTFLNKGRCNRGNKCRFRHELPKRGTGARQAREEQEKKNKSRNSKGEKKMPRVSLYQRMVEKEREQENELKLAAAIDSEERGMLNNPQIQEIDSIAQGAAMPEVKDELGVPTNLLEATGPEREIKSPMSKIPVDGAGEN